MSEPDFENELRRQQFRNVPAGWKDEILQAASSSRQVAARPGITSWYELLWPSPKAWFGLAAAWVFIALLNIASTNRKPSIAGEATNRDTLMAVESQRQLRNELLQDLQPEQTPNSARPNPPERRSERPLLVRWSEA